MRNYRRISILASSLAFILVCFWFVINSSRLAQDKSLDADVRTAVRELAPLGGTGTKESYYPSGSLKEKTHWKNYEVLRIEYHDLSGRNIYTADLKNGGGLLLDINDDGVIEEIYETVAYSRNGSRLAL